MPAQRHADARCEPRPYGTCQPWFAGPFGQGRAEFPRERGLPDLHQDRGSVAQVGVDVGGHPLRAAAQQGPGVPSPIGSLSTYTTREAGAARCATCSATARSAA